MEKTKPGPLDGITVLDFTWVLAGPFATRTLADMGAYVIKIERYKDGTNERHLPLIMENDGVKQSSYNINCNRGKKSVCINLKDPRGKPLIQEILEVAGGRGKGYVEYCFVNPVTNQVEDKVVYIEKCGDLIIYVGVFK